MNSLEEIINSIECDRMLYEILMQHKNMLHEQIDILIKRKISKDEFKLLCSADTGGTPCIMFRLILKFLISKILNIYNGFRSACSVYHCVASPSLVTNNYYSLFQYVQNTNFDMAEVFFVNFITTTEAIGTYKLEKKGVSNCCQFYLQ
jgi:hypothetical protein